MLGSTLSGEYLVSRSSYPMPLVFSFRLKKFFLRQLPRRNENRFKSLRKKPNSTKKAKTPEEKTDNAIFSDVLLHVQTYHKKAPTENKDKSKM